MKPRRELTWIGKRTTQASNPAGARAATPPPRLSPVTVNGRFLTTHSSGSQTFTNVIEAISMTCS